MKKTLKTKVAAGVLTASMLMGVTTAFAATNPGTALGAWYANQLYNAKYAAEDTAFSGLMNKLCALAQQGADLSVDTVAGVALAGTTEEDRANDAINDAKNTYISQLEEKQGELEGEMPGEFDTFVRIHNAGNDGVADARGVEIYGKIETAVTDQGNASLGAVDTNVKATKRQAVEDLQKAIEDSKKHLQALLDQEQGIATDELVANIDLKIAALKQKLIDDTKTLYDLTEGQIKAAGLAIENDANTEMELLVNAI